jgi:hypothetical protein
MSGTSDWLPFLVRFWASKNEQVCFAIFLEVK